MRVSNVDIRGADLAPRTQSRRPRKGHRCARKRMRKSLQPSRVETKDPSVRCITGGRRWCTRLPGEVCATTMTLLT